MARINIHIEADSAGDLHAELEQLLRGNRYGCDSGPSTGGTGATLGALASSFSAGEHGEPANSTDDRRVETVENVQASDDLKPVRGKNADDLAAKLIAEYGVMSTSDWNAQHDRLPKKHQEQVAAGIAPSSDTTTEQPAQQAGSYKLVGGQGATIGVFDEADQFVSQLEDIAAKLGHRSDILALASANSDVVKSLTAADQKRLEDAFGEALKAAKDDATPAPAQPTSETAEPAAGAKPLTIDDVRAAVTEVANKLGMEAGRKVVVETGKAAKISELDAANYQAVLDECARLLPAKAG